MRTSVVGASVRLPRIRPGSLLPTVGAAARVWGVVVRIRLERFIRSKGTATMGTHQMIRAEVLSWPGVTEAPHRFGGVEFRLGKRELGHLHGNYLADLPFPVRVREELVRDGKAMPHHILPQSGWVSYPIRDAAAVPGAIDLFRLAYERAVGVNHRDTENIEGRGEN